MHNTWNMGDISQIISVISVHTFIEVINVQNESKKIQEKMIEQTAQGKFNYITEKTTPENQNQEHNVRKEAIGPVNQKR